MNDLISRQAAIDMLEMYPFVEYEEYAEAREVINRLPSAQPDIIRCPDCYYNDGTAYCELHFRNVKAKDFCSWAERRLQTIYRERVKGLDIADTENTADKAESEEIGTR